MALSPKVEKSAISNTHVDTNMMVVSHIKNQLKIWKRIEKCLQDCNFQKFAELQTLNFRKKLAERNET